MNIIDGFDDLHTRLNEIVKTDSWKTLVHQFKEADNIYLIGNGGNWAVCSHGACDMSRLFSKNNVNKNIECLDSQSIITSISNDYGYNHLFMRWIKMRTDLCKDKKSMVLGISCSGNSKNIIGPLTWAQENNFNTTLISGIKSHILSDEINEVVLDTNFFHSGEVLTLMLFYQLIHECDTHCPTIKEEIIRKGIGAPLSRNPLN